MNQAVATTTHRPMEPLDIVRAQMNKSKGEFEKVLPSNMTFEKFQRVVVTACLNDPDLLLADRQSLLLSAMKCATDGLLPDKREAAFVIFNKKVKFKDESGNEKERWTKLVQYMPMYVGVLKRLRQAMDVATITAHAVYDKDTFNYVLGDTESITHLPYQGGGDPGPVKAAYCIITTKDGDKIRGVMSHFQIEKVRKTSKSGSNDKGDPTGIWLAWYDQMSIKTVLRRTCKLLPQSSDVIDRILDSDDTMVGMADIDAEAPIEHDATPPAALTDDSDQPNLVDQINASRGEKEPVPVNDTQPEPKPAPAKADAPAYDEKLLADLIADLQQCATLKAVENFWEHRKADINPLKGTDGFLQLGKASDAHEQKLGRK